MGIKGQKINPVLWRIGTSRKWKSLWVQDSWNYGNMLHKTLKIQEILESFLIFSRYPSLNCGVTILNQGSDKFLVMVYFYALRSFKYNAIPGREKSSSRASGQDLKNRWKFETKKLLKKPSNLLERFLVEEKSLLFEWLKNKKWGAHTGLKKAIKLENKNFKEAFLGEILRRSSPTIDKFTAGALVRPQKESGKFLNFKNFAVFEDQSLLLKHILASLKYKNSVIGLNIRSFHNYVRRYSLVEALLLHLYFNPLTISRQKQVLMTKKLSSFYKIYKNFSFFVNSFCELLFTQRAKQVNRRLNIQITEPLFVSKHNDSFNGKKFPLNAYALNTLQQARFIDRNERRLKSPRKKNSQALKRKTEEKLLKIKSLAILNKIKRLNLTKALSIWQSYIEPLTRNFRYYFVKGKNQYKQRKSYLVKVFLERLSHHLYHTMPQDASKKIGTLENGKAGLKVGSYKTQLFTRHLLSRSSLISQTTHLSLKDLHSIVEFLLNAKVEIFFVNSLSLLKFQSRFIPFATTGSNGKFSKLRLFQQIRAAKININRQYQRLSKQPALLANRNSKRGPYLHDFILLTLIALTTRNLKVLVRFMGMQISRLGQNKRQIPFIRFLIRLLANLSGTLIKLKGFRIQFKGRFDRWNRTKSIVYTNGNIPFQRQNLDIEFCSSHGLIKKGLFGIRLWVWYGTNYHFLYHRLLTNYWCHFINKK